MQHKRFALLAGIIMVSLLIAPVGIAGAQAGMPPVPGFLRMTVMPSNHIPDLNQIQTPHGLFPFINSGTKAPAASVGESGFSFSEAGSFGVPGEPYPVDATNNAYLNNPRGISTDSAGNLYVAERSGSRVQKFDSTGSLVLSLGHAGQPWHHDDFLPQPQDVTVRSGDGHIWIISSPVLKEFDASGLVVQAFPAINPWESGPDNGHFNDPKGLAFGAGGYLYVSDAGNHRIQIFDVSANPLTYVGTIGTTGVPGSDDAHFNYPIQVAFDSLNRLYVVDDGNFRVQRCESSAPWTSWVCSTFYGETGVQGSDLGHMSFSDGIGIDPSDNIFLADGGNERVLKCDTAASCAVFVGETGIPGSDNAHFNYANDVAIDASGNVYVSDPDNFRVQKFNSAGVYQSTLGVTGVPYPPNTTHLNNPWGIAQAADGGFYVTENMGYRLIKLDTNGAQQWAVGEAGVYGNDNAHFGVWWGGLEGSPAVDASGRVYVGDTPNDRVQIFNADGTYYNTLGTGSGTGNYQFGCPTDIAIRQNNGDIYVMDRCNQRIQVFTSGLVYKGTIGTPQQSGSDNLHFNWAWGIAVDVSGDVFVADHDNQRIQKCTLSAVAPGFACSTFLGEVNVSGEDFNHFGGPIDVGLDSAGRVYVVDEWNGRVQVFDASGAYLTTLGGIGDGLNSPSGIVITADGSVYIADRQNHRIARFTLGTPGWKQSNINGFGDWNNQDVFSLTTFSNQLYAGMLNFTTGGQIWRSSDGKTWSSVMTNGFGDVTNVGIDDLLAFNNQLYAGVYNWDGVAGQSNGGQIWRSTNGTTWTQVIVNGFDPLTNSEFFRFVVYDGQLYASTWVDNTAHGGEVWRSPTGDSNDWTRVVNNGFGDVAQSVVSFASHANYLYAGTFNNVSGASVWRSASGAAGDWTQVNVGGFGDSTRIGVSALVSYKGYLYASVTRAYGTGGTEIWRCQVCDGTDWAQVSSGGLGDPSNESISALEVSSGRLYLVLGNFGKGMSVWRSDDGLTWEQIAQHGFGNSNNGASYWDNSVTSFGGTLYVGTLNWSNGGQVWQLAHQIYLPLIMR
ncbi:MAG: hypothetical protein Fur0035_11740 [Anaerolineales bacterium]